MKLVGPDADVLVVAGLVFVVIVLVVLSRIGLLPKKSLPYVGVTLLGALGVAVFRRWRSAAERRVLDDRRDTLVKLEGDAQKARERLEAGDQAYRDVQAEIHRQEEALQKRSLLAQAENAGKRQEIETMSGEEVFKRFRETFGDK